MKKSVIYYLLLFIFISMSETSFAQDWANLAKYETQNNQLPPKQSGEKRIFSLKEDGSLSFSVHLKNNGTLEVGGNTDNMVRYQKLDDALQAEKNLINAELSKIAAAINAIVPGSYTPAPITLNLIQAKIDEIKAL